MQSKGVEFDPACRIYEVCNPHRAKEVLEKNLAVSTALPCRIAMYEQGGQVRLATILPTAMMDLFDQPDLRPVAQEVERTIRQIMDDAVRD